MSNENISIFQKKIKLKPNLFDSIIVFLSLLLAIGSLIYVNVSFSVANSKSGDKIATVYYLDQKIKQVNLSKLEAIEKYEINKEDYAMMISDMEITFDPNEGIAVTYSDCTDHVCILNGYTNSANDPIVCLPNSVYVIITIESSKNNGGFLE